MTHPMNTMERKRDEYFTPPEIYKPLGDFDLDPCTTDYGLPKIAANYYHRAENGLAQPWFGRVWLNPPYGNEQGERYKHNAGAPSCLIAYGDVDMVHLYFSGLPGWFVGIGRVGQMPAGKGGFDGEG